MSSVPEYGALGAVVVALARTLIEQKVISPTVLHDMLVAMRREIAADGAPGATLARFDKLAGVIPPDAPAASWYRTH